MGDGLSFGLCRFSVGVAVGLWVMGCHLGCVTLVLPFSVAVAAGWWVTVCHLGSGQANFRKCFT